MQFLPCAWGPGVATTRSERCESKTRPALETLPSAFSVSPYSHTPFSSHFGSRPFLPSLLRSLAAAPFLLCFLSSFIFGRTPSRSPGHPRPGRSRSAGAGGRRASPAPPRDILRALPRHVAASFNRVGNAVSRSEKAMLHHFYRKIK